MLVPVEMTFAIRCPQCGQIEPATISRFQLGKGSAVKVTCSCGSHKMTVSMNRGQVCLQVPCYLCDGVHFLYYSSPRFWREGLQQVACSETDLQLGVLGPENEVITYVGAGGSELERLLEDEAFSEYFDHPEVMYEALHRVHTLADEGNMSCSCGHRQITVDIFPEHLELCCSSCGRRKTVLAGSEEDLAALLHMTYVKVGEDTAPRRQGKK